MQAKANLKRFLINFLDNVRQHKDASKGKQRDSRGLT